MAHKCPRHLDAYRLVYDELSVTQKGILLRGQRIVVPSGLRQQIMQLAHLGHQGIVRTKSLIRSRVWFPGIDKAVEAMIKRCRECQAVTDRPTYEPLKPSELPSGPWRVVAGDFFGPMADGRYWFVNYDEYSRWTTVDDVSSCSFDQVKQVLETIFSLIGSSHVYKSDNGSPFQSYQFAEFAKHWGFNHRRITPLWPRANAASRVL